MEEKLINLCDLMCPQGNKVFTIDKRLIDIMIRRGAYSNTQYHIKETYKLKEYFDDLLGYNLYDLFPEIKDNLQKVNGSQLNIFKNLELYVFSHIVFFDIQKHIVVLNILLCVFLYKKILKIFKKMSYFC